jgi:DNA-binding NarL/FixJ family response regulator
VTGCAWGHCRATRSLLAEDRRRALAEMATGSRLLQRSPATVAAPFLGLQVLALAVEGDRDAALAEAERVRASGATRHRIVGSLLGYAEAVLAGRTGRGAEAADRFAAPVPRTGRGDSVVPPDLQAIGVTSREADVLALVAEGLTNPEIGARLHLSPRTVEKHVASLLAKTGGQRRMQLAKRLRQ